MGHQFVSLARFARHFGEIELCAEIGGRFEKMVRDDVEERDGAWRIVAEPSNPDFEIFHPFLLPLIRTTKDQMVEDAEERGYTLILSRTWSCWFPRPDGSPCRRCEMCRRRPLT